jgi:hypothetical protein
MIDLSIIIVSWNCKEYLQKCLRSIVSYPPICAYEIVVVDNASSDGTIESVRLLFPEVKIIVNDKNQGFAAANNIALKQCQNRYFLLLNPDTIVFHGALQALVEYADRHSNAWGVGPAIVNADGSPQRTGIRFPNNWNILVETLFLDKIFPQSRIFGSHRELYIDPSLARKVDYVQGSCLLIKHEAIQIIGMLDEKYFMYFEETDWCYRVHQMGGEVHYISESTIKHYGGSESAHYDSWKVLQYHRSLLRYYKKHYSIFSRILIRCILFIRSLIRAFGWAVVMILHPLQRKKALSTCNGYCKLIPLLFTKVR